MSKKVLIVDDDSIIALSEAKVIRSHGYEVDTAYSGEKAVQKLQDDPEIALILMDIHLGKGMDGPEAAEKILQNHDIPIVFLTSHTEKEYVDRVEKITGYGYVTKTSGEFVLIRSIDMAFKLHEANRKIKEKEARYETLFESASDAILIMDKNKFTDCNQAAVELFGCANKNELIGHCPWEFSPPQQADGRDSHTSAAELIEASLKGKRQFFAWRHIKKDGTPFEAEISLNPLVLGPDTFLLSIVRDITNQKQLELKLREREQHFRAIADYTYDWEDWIGLDGNLVWVNPAVERITGYSPQECYQMDNYPKPIVHPEDLEILDHDIQNGIENQTSFNNREFRCICKNDRERWLSVSWQPLYNDRGTYLGIRSSIRDITEKKHTEVELNESVRQKDVLLKELNHRVKNNLTMVSSLLSLKDFALGDTADLSDLKRRIETIRMLHEKLNYSDTYSVINPREYLQDILDGVFSSFSSGEIEIQNNIQDITLPTKIAIPLGLITNEIATNAMKYGFTYSEKAVFALSFETDQKRKEYIFSLSNSGKPFPEHIDLYTAETLGLKLVSTLVLQLRGQIDVCKAPHPRFTISFPIPSAS